MRTALFWVVISASGGNFLPTLRDKVSGPIFRGQEYKIILNLEP